MNLEKHRDLARISLGRIPAGPSIAIFLEWMFQLLQPVGIPDQVIAYAGDLSALYVGAFAFEESLGLPPPPARTCRPRRSSPCCATTSRRCPRTGSRTHARRSTCCSRDDPDRFEFGLDLLVRGLETYANTKS